MLIKVCAFTEKGMNLANTIFEENKELIRKAEMELKNEK